MRTLILAAILGFCAYLSYSHFSAPAARFHADGTPNVRLYVHPKCGDLCDKAKSFLQKRHVEFEVADAAQDWDSYYKVGGRDSFPTLIAGNHVVHGFNPGEFQTAMADTLGKEALWGREWSVLQKNFDSTGDAKVLMYSTTTCGNCSKTRDQLHSAGIDFSEVFIDRDTTAKDDFQTLFGSGTPLVFKGYKRQEGYNRRAVSNLL